MNTQAWGRYEAVVGRENWKKARPGEEPPIAWLASVEFRAPSDNAADSFARRLSEALFNSEYDCPRHHVFPLPGAEQR